MARVNVHRSDPQLADEGSSGFGWFDTDRAEFFKEETEWNGNNNVGVISGLQCGYEGIYHTKGGRWVRYYNARDEFNGPEFYEFITAEQAREWLLSNGDDETVERLFGEIEDERGPGRPGIGNLVTVRLGDLIDRVDARARELGKSRADMIRDLVVQALG